MPPAASAARQAAPNHRPKALPPVAQRWYVLLSYAVFAVLKHGRTQATRVMRKHRLAECLLVGVIGLPWEEVHIEACRWEHVISDNVERRLVELLQYPVRCPH